MAIEAVIFDMDGVLVESEPYWELSRREFAAELGKDWTPELHREAMGLSTIGWATFMKERLSLDLSVEAITREVKSRVIAHYEEKMPSRPGAIESVFTMSERYRVALASGSPTDIIERVIALTGIDQVLEVVTFGDTVPNGKPAPDIYHVTLDRMGLGAAQAVGVEDSGNGVRSLKAAGMWAIAAPSPGFPLPQTVLDLADVHIASMTSLNPELIASLPA